MLNESRNFNERGIINSMGQLELSSDFFKSFYEGDQGAFKTIYFKYVDGLRFFCYKYVSDKEQIDDVVQDAFVALYVNRKLLKSECAIKAFLYKKVKNDCLNIHRHNGVKERYVALTNQEEGECFLDNLIQSEVYQQVMDAFHELPDSCQRVYKLSLQGKTQAEISSILNISINTIKSHINKANHLMRNRLSTLLLLFYLIWQFKKR